MDRKNGIKLVKNSPTLLNKLEQQYNRTFIKKIVFFIICILVLLYLIIINISMGAASLNFGAIIQHIAAKIFFKTNLKNFDPVLNTIVWDLRMPRICMAILAGAGLGIAGTVMQGILRNPLVSPFTLGISAASGFGAALAIVTGIGIIQGGEIIIVSNAFLFSLIAIFMVYLLSKIRGITSTTLILSGVAIMYLFSALTSMLQYIATTDQLQGVVFWLMGSLGNSSWEKNLIIFIIHIIIIPIFLLFSWDLNSMLTGEESAKSFGTNVNLVMIICMLLSSLSAASIVCFNGIISFIGLVAPHIARLIIGSDHRYLIPASGILGSIILLTSDLIARTVLSPTELPLGIMTSLLGVPFFIYILLTKKKGI